jgi:hypothetical protein
MLTLRGISFVSMKSLGGMHVLAECRWEGITNKQNSQASETRTLI